jgi:DNA-binding transcriptional LysR family regulator
VVDLVEERFDVGIRAGPLADSTLIARGLGNVRRLLVASRGYLRKRGRPRAPEDLAAHDCILFGAGSARASYRLTDGTRTVDVPVRARLTINDLDVLHEAASAGLGIALLPIFRCMEEVRARRLTRVLEGWDAPLTPIHAVYPSLRHLSPKVKSFVDHLQAQLSPPPWELGPRP